MPISVPKPRVYVPGPDTVSVAVDFVKGRVWYRVNGGMWHNDPLVAQADSVYFGEGVRAHFSFGNLTVT